MSLNKALGFITVYLLEQNMKVKVNYSLSLDLAVFSFVTPFLNSDMDNLPLEKAKENKVVVSLDVITK
jgi:hypothetical protein